MIDKDEPCRVHKHRIGAITEQYQYEIEGEAAGRKRNAKQVPRSPLACNTSDAEKHVDARIRAACR